MKLCFSTLGCPRWSWGEVLRQAAALGFRGIEPRGVLGELDNRRIPEFQPGKLEETAKGLKRLGLAVPCLDTSVTYLDGGNPEEKLREGLASATVAKGLGAPCIRVFGDTIPEGMQQSEAALIVAASLQALAERCEPLGVSVLLEAHGDFVTSPALLEVFSHVASPAAAILWDAAHTCAAGETPEQTWRQIGPLVRHVHIKDYTPRDGHALPCAMGQGDLPASELLRVLAGAGYDGWLSLEWEKRWHEELAEPEEAFPAFLRYISPLLKM